MLVNCPRRLSCSQISRTRGCLIPTRTSRSAWCCTVEQERNFEDSPREIQIGWDGTYALDGDTFVVNTKHPLIGSRVIHCFPVNELRQ